MHVRVITLVREPRLRVRVLHVCMLARVCVRACAGAGACARVRGLLCVHVRTCMRVHVRERAINTMYV